MSTIIRKPAVIPTGAPETAAFAVYGNWGVQVEAPAEGRRVIEYVRAVNKRPYVAYVYSRWIDASNNNTPAVLEGPIKIFPGDSYDFGIGVTLLPGDTFEMRTDQSDSCDTTKVWTDFKV